MTTPNAATAERLARLAKWVPRLTKGVGLLYAGLGSLVGVYVYLTTGIVPALGILAVVFVADFPLVRLREDAVYRTDAAPEEVREQFGTVLNPVVWTWLAWLEPDHPAVESGGEATADPSPADAPAVARAEEGTGANPPESALAVATVSSLVRSGTEATLTHEPREDGGVCLHVRAAGRLLVTATVSIEPDGDGTRVTTSVRQHRSRPRQLVALTLSEPLERRARSHLGYRKVESRTYVGLRGW